VGWLAVAVCGLAGLFDAWTTRIPNRLTYVAILMGLGLNEAAGVAERVHWEAAVRWLGAAGPAQSVLGFGVCAAVGIVGRVVARVGGGDVKLLAALGALLGLSQTGAVLVVALTAAVVYAVINLALVGRLNRVARMGAWKVMELIYLGRLEIGEETTEARGLSVPMAVPLAIGVLVVQVMGVRMGVAR
jgi:prepilin signal peptidase PulO-like enzyme (type II secretory pathway)